MPSFSGGYEAVQLYETSAYVGYLDTHTTDTNVQYIHMYMYTHIYVHGHKCLVVKDMLAEVARKRIRFREKKYRKVKHIEV